MSAPRRDEVTDRHRAKQRRALATAYEAGELDEATFIAKGADLRTQHTEDALAATPAIVPNWTRESIEDFRTLFKKAYRHIAAVLDNVERAEGDQAEQWATISGWAFEAFEYHGDDDLRYHLSRATDAQLLRVARSPRS